MILGQISYLDCLVFVLFLAPQLLLQVGVIGTASCVAKVLPFLVLQMPYQLIRERFCTPYKKRSPFVQQATLFQDLVIRCVRYAFARIPASIGKVFFSKAVALPFFRFRKLRNFVFRPALQWQEVHWGGVRGIWISMDQTRKPDIVVYYCHGGGFSMGSSFFYIEFLMAWAALLKDQGFSNPAVFALEYTLVPEATYPRQLDETRRGYEYVLSLMGDSSRICVGGDSAGATLILSLLLSLSEKTSELPRMPGLATIISPWAIVLSDQNKNTPSDYLNADSLKLYGSQYIGTKASGHDPLVSPGVCKDVDRWRRASPTRGWFFTYGAEEVFAPDTRDLVSLLRKTDTQISVQEEPQWIHAWPVVKLFLCDTQTHRLSGLKSIVKVTRERLGDMI